MAKSQPKGQTGYEIGISALILANKHSKLQSTTNHCIPSMYIPALEESCPAKRNRPFRRIRDADDPTPRNSGSGSRCVRLVGHQMVVYRSIDSTVEGRSWRWCSIVMHTVDFKTRSGSNSAEGDMSCWDILGYSKRLLMGWAAIGNKDELE